MKFRTLFLTAAAVTALGAAAPAGHAAAKPGFPAGTWSGKGTISGKSSEYGQETRTTGSATFTLKVTRGGRVSGTGKWVKTEVGSGAISSTIKSIARVRFGGTATRPTYAGTQNVTTSFSDAVLSDGNTFELPFKGALRITRAGHCRVTGGRRIDGRVVQVDGAARWQRHLQHLTARAIVCRGWDRGSSRVVMRATAIVSAILGGVALAPAAAGSPGDLDGSFSGDGWLRTLEVRSSDNNYLPRVAEDVAVQPDGRIVAVGEMIDGGSSWYFGAFRYLPNGNSTRPSGRAAGSTTTWAASSSHTPSPCNATAGSWWPERATAATRAASCSPATGRTAVSIPASAKEASCGPRLGACTGRAPSTCRSRPTAGSWRPGSCRRAATARTARISPWPATSPTAASTRASRATGGQPSTSATATTSPTRSPISAAAGSSWRARAPATATAPRTTSRSRASGETAAWTGPSRVTEGAP